MTLTRKLPVDDFINNGLLFGGGTTEVDARGLYAFVAHEVSQQGEIVETVKEVLGETMAERMWIDYSCVDAVFLSEQFELLRNATCCDSFSETVEKDITGI